MFIHRSYDQKLTNFFVGHLTGVLLPPPPNLDMGGSIMSVPVVLT